MEGRAKGADRKEKKDIDSPLGSEDKLSIDSNQSLRKEGQKMLQIGEFSKICQVSIKTLHHYDRIGLLAPAKVDRFTGYRYYQAGQIDMMNYSLTGFWKEELRVDRNFGCGVYVSPRLFPYLSL